jgi:prevent-host-death family protein
VNSIKISIREAKIILSRLIRRAQRGDEVILTNRNRPVARIVSIPEKALSLSDRIRELEQEGIIEAAERKQGSRLPEPIFLPGGLAQKFLQEDRNG